MGFVRTFYTSAWTLTRIAWTFEYVRNRMGVGVASRSLRGTLDAGRRRNGRGREKRTTSRPMESVDNDLRIDFRYPLTRVCQFTRRSLDVSRKRIRMAIFHARLDTQRRTALVSVSTNVLTVF